MDGDKSSTTNTLDISSDVATSVRLLQMLKDNRIEMMVITILLWSTGVLEKAVTYGQGVC